MSPESVMSAWHHVVTSRDPAALRAILADDRLRFGSGTAIDVNLYRAASGVLRTDSRLDLVGEDLLAQQGVVGGEVKLGATGSGPGMAVGTAHLYVEGGALKFKGGSGTVTTVAVA